MADRAYTFRGRRVPLRRVADAATVVAGSAEMAAVLRGKLALSSSVRLGSSSPSSSESSADYMVVRGGAGLAESMRSEPEVRHTRGVFASPGGHELALGDDVVVEFEPGVSAADRAGACARAGARLVRDLGTHGVVRVTDPAPDAPLDVADELTGRPGVLSATPDMLQDARLAAETGAVPRFERQWYLHDAVGPAAPADLRILSAWAYGRGSPSVRVAIIDTGVDVDHPNLLGQFEPGLNVRDGGVEVRPVAGPNDWHGTACAGLVAAAANGTGIVGVASGCRIVPVRAQGMLPWSRWAEAITWAALHAEVILGAWALEANALVESAVRAAAVTGRGGAGAVVVFSAGNEGGAPVAFPAMMDEALAVGASTDLDVAAPYANAGDGLDVVAPSGGGTRGVETTDLVGARGTNDEGDYCDTENGTYFSGTSAAGALAAGVAALVLSANGGLSGEAVRDILRRTARKIDVAGGGYDPGLGWSPRYGFGCIDAAAAVEAARAAGGTTGGG